MPFQDYKVNFSIQKLGYCFSVNKKKQYFEQNQKMYAKSTIQILKVDDRVGVASFTGQEEGGDTKYRQDT